MNTNLQEINSKRRFEELLQLPEFADETMKSLKSNSRKYVKPSQKESIFRFDSDGQDELGFDDLFINEEDEQGAETNEKIEIFDSDQEVVMHIDSDKQLTSLLLNQHHLTLRQKLEVCKNYEYEQSPRDFSSQEFENGNNMYGFEENASEFENLNDDRFDCSNYEIQYEFNQVNEPYYESYDDIYKQENIQYQIEIVDIGYLNESFNEELLSLNNSVCQPEEKHLEIEDNSISFTENDENSTNSQIQEEVDGNNTAETMTFNQPMKQPQFKELPRVIPNRLFTKSQMRKKKLRVFRSKTNSLPTHIQNKSTFYFASIHKRQNVKHLHELKRELSLGKKMKGIQAQNLIQSC